MAFPQNTLDAVRESVSLADLVGESVTLKRSGKNLTGLCPFHNEKSPSFFVNDEEGFFRCFGCGKKGSVFDFVMETRGLSFPEAVRFLARRGGVELPDQPQTNRVEEERKRKALLTLREVMERAVSFYRGELKGPRGAAVRAYLERRKLQPSTAEAFKVGFAPDTDCVEQAVRASFGERFPEYFKSEDEFLSALRSVGLVTVKEQGRRYDTFRGRLIFPISKSDGSVIALGGRILIDAPHRPKYLNSSESPLYSKSKTLFALSQALPTIRKSREVYLVEGYMDVLSMYGAGHENVVAACGTAITPEHVKVLKRFVERVVAVFDGDAAGMRAAASCFEVFLNSGIDVQAVILPEKEDPSSLVENGQGEALAALLQNRIPIIDMFMNQRLGTAGPTISPTAAGKVAQEISKILRKVQNLVEREFLVRRVSERLGVSEASVISLIENSSRFSEARGGERRRADFGSPPPEAFDAPPPDEYYSSSGGGAHEEESRDGADSQAPAQSSAKAAAARAPGSPVLDAYCHQMLVAVVCDPPVARSVLQMGSVAGKETLGILPASVRAAIEEFARTPGEGITSIVQAQMRAGGFDKNSKSLRAEVQWIADLLMRFGLPVDAILSEGIRQASVGGSRPDVMVKQAPLVATRMSLSRDIERIRESETQEQDAERLAALAQEKLLKRRSLDRQRS